MYVSPCGICIRRIGDKTVSWATNAQHKSDARGCEGNIVRVVEERRRFTLQRCEQLMGPEVPRAPNASRGNVAFTECCIVYVSMRQNGSHARIGVSVPHVNTCTSRSQTTRNASLRLSAPREPTDSIKARCEMKRK